MPASRVSVPSVKKRSPKSESESERRRYRQFCGVARALDVVGERWTLLLVRNLLLGPRRYSDLLAELPGITTNLLAKRLSDLVDHGIVRKASAGVSLSMPTYELTESGAALEPVIMELGRWGGRFMAAPQSDDTINIGWGLLSMKRRYVGGLTLVAEFDIGGRLFELAFSPGYLAVQERAAIRPDVQVSGSAQAFRAWLFQNASAVELRKRSTLMVQGSATAWKSLTSAFVAPA